MTRRRPGRLLVWVVPAAGALIGIGMLLTGSWLAGAVQLALMAVIGYLIWLGNNPAEELDAATAARLQDVLWKKPHNTKLLDADTGAVLRIARRPRMAWRIYRVDAAAAREAEAQLDLGADVAVVSGAVYTLAGRELRRYTDAAPVRWVEDVGWRPADGRQRRARLVDRFRTRVFYRRTNILVVPQGEVVELIGQLLRAQPDPGDQGTLWG